jgi:radical SAM protein with 4Fe4S-binding SPASM domain
MEIQQYEDWSLRIAQATVEQRIPLSGTIEITCRCNLRCDHCYNNLPLTSHIPEGGELSTEEHYRILDEITEAGCLWLLYTGGEIFVRKDFLDIYTYAKKKGLLVTLFTNATLLSPEVADYLAEWRPYSVEISLYGRSRETYERVTGVPGSYDRCMRGIRLLLERKLPLKLKTLVTRINKHELWEMKRFAEEDLGLEFRFDAMINPRIDCSQEPLSLRLTPQEVVQLDLQDHKRAEEWIEFCQQFHGAFTNRPNKLYQCGGGISTFHINPAGMMGVCVLARSENYEIRKGDFREGWDHFLLKTTEKEITRQTKCVGCEIHDMCGMCPPNGELENEDAEEPVDFFCQVAHLRAYALGISVGPHGECEYCQGGSKYQDMMQAVEALRGI